MNSSFLVAVNTRSPGERRGSGSRTVATQSGPTPTATPNCFSITAEKLLQVRACYRPHSVCVPNSTLVPVRSTRTTTALRIVLRHFRHVMEVEAQVRFLCAKTRYVSKLFLNVERFLRKVTAFVLGDQAKRCLQVDSPDRSPVSRTSKNSYRHDSRVISPNHSVSLRTPARRFVYETVRPCNTFAHLHSPAYGRGCFSSSWLAAAPLSVHRLLLYFYRLALLPKGGCWK